MTAAATMERNKLAPGDRVKFGTPDKDTRRWWNVRAADDRFVVLTRQAEFQKRGTLLYTIIDWDRGVRGPCNRIGQGWDVESPGGCSNLLLALNGMLPAKYREG